MHETVRGVDQTCHAKADAREVFNGKPTTLAGLGHGLEHDFDKLIRVHTGIRDGELLAHHILALEIQHKHRNDFVTQFHASDQMRLSRQLDRYTWTTASALGLFVLGDDLLDQTSIQKFRRDCGDRGRAKACGIRDVDSCNLSC